MDRHCGFVVQVLDLCLREKTRVQVLTAPYLNSTPIHFRPRKGVTDTCQETEMLHTGSTFIDIGVITCGKMGVESQRKRAKPCLRETVGSFDPVIQSFLSSQLANENAKRPANVNKDGEILYRVRVHSASSMLYICPVGVRKTIQTAPPERFTY